MTGNKVFRISGTGCALVDYLYKPVDFSDDLFARYMSRIPGDGGLDPGKLVFTEEFGEFAGEDYIEARNKLTRGRGAAAVNIGGPSIVSLINVAQLLHDLPVEGNFYGCKGRDEGSAFIERMVQRTPLGIGRYDSVERYTAFTDVLCDPYYDNGHGERIFINNIGAAWEMVPDMLDGKFFASDMVVFGGTALVPRIHDSLLTLLRRAKGNGCITVVNTVYDFRNQKHNPGVRWPLGESDESYRYIDLLIADKEEALRLSGSTDTDGAFGFFRERGAGAVIVTHGAEKVFAYSTGSLFGDNATFSLPVSARVIKELKEAPGGAGDTTGCGDNFAGGVIASVARQLVERPGNKADLTEAVIRGIVSGGHACFYHGGTFFEEFPGQKAGLTAPYYEDYLRQTGM